ncbi:MAG: FkbM family methyltransferase [Saprospiraceae bacterium]|nr:FkbM family methyltransferase [Saprospiraceae bacterium]MCF8252370.1 FkbM family methyltransferase [Saprospiraceae bacterium]MCF8282211.1 FkbM family methyltransferase [Bacteroidales bacterium]MCF8311838.1 FkbM family methyltransferase [Saprospiraceae bacterium]MCF8442682.1 FkbM family methyltransferase [Saprospiraceae bacterium]
MFGKISRLASLFKIYGFHAFHLLFNPVLGRPIWVPLNGRRVWLNFDSATYYHLIHSTDKVKALVDAIPSNLQGVILDGGANHGLFSMLAAQKFPNVKIFALEPYHKVLPILKKNVAGTQVEIVEKAIAAKDGEVVFYTAPSSDQVGSVIKDNVAEFTAKGAAIVESRVPAISLKSFVKEQGIERIAVLKLDVQGLEFAILEHADQVLDITDCLLLEVVLIEKTSLELLEKARQFFPYHKILNPLPYGADIIFSKNKL